MERILITIIIVLIAAFMAYKVVTLNHSKSALLLTFYANDLSLIVETLQSVPGDIEMYYPIKEGFVVTLKPYSVYVRYPEEDRDNEHYFHLSPGYAIEESTVTKTLLITKKNGVITFTNDYEEERQEQTGEDITCPSPLHLKSESFSVSFETGTAGLYSTFDKADLELFKTTFDHQFQLQNVPIATDSEPTIKVTLSSEQAPSDLGSTLYIRRPDADSEIERNYQHLFCAYATSLEDLKLVIIEDLTYQEADPYALELVFAVTPGDKEEVLKNRAYYAAQLAGVLKPFVLEGGAAS